MYRRLRSSIKHKLTTASASVSASVSASASTSYRCPSDVTELENEGEAEQNQQDGPKSLLLSSLVSPSVGKGTALSPLPSPVARGDFYRPPRDEGDIDEEKESGIDNHGFVDASSSSSSTSSLPSPRTISANSSCCSLLMTREGGGRGRTERMPGAGALVATMKRSLFYEKSGSRARKKLCSSSSSSSSPFCSHRHPYRKQPSTENVVVYSSVLKYYDALGPTPEREEEKGGIC